MIDAHILLALVEMAANQEFADSGAVADVLAKFRDIANNLTASLIRLIDQDGKDEANYNLDIANSNAAADANTAQINQNNPALKVNAEVTT
jgi:hypothetical protein